MTRERTVGIVGYGAVGSALHRVFPDAVIYDEPLRIGTRDEVNAREFVFVCVPTPPASDGSCDASIVDAVVSWLDARVIIIRSTVYVGCTDALREKYHKRIVFQPEYGGPDTPEHPYNDLRDVRWMILGGERADTIAAADLYKTVFSAAVVIQQTDARTAELAKYMENCYLALKVAFCNEFFDIASAVGVDYNELRELWLLDPRIGRSHTFVYPDDRGFGGKCLPKDLSALIQLAQRHEYPPQLMQALQDTNSALRQRSIVA